MHTGGLWEQAVNHVHPAWTRLFFLAMCRTGTDGHAGFDSGELGILLGTNPSTGEVDPMDRQNVRRAIRRGIEQGVLAEQSGSRCLVLPAHLVSKGKGSGSRSTCTKHPARSHQMTHKTAERTSSSDYSVRHSVTTRPASDQAKRSRPLDSVSLPKSA